jgi:hypothetical protein
VAALKDTFKVESIAPGHCTGEPTFAALKKTFGDRYLYAGLGTILPLEANTRSDMRRGEGPALQQDDLTTYRRLARREDPFGILQARRLRTKSFAVVKMQRANVPIGSFATELGCSRNVRYSPIATELWTSWKSVRAMSGHPFGAHAGPHPLNAAPEAADPRDKPEHRDSADQIGDHKTRRGRRDGDKAMDHREGNPHRSDEQELARFKVRSATGTSVCGSPVSFRAPAKPKPCSSPNANATTQG